MGSVSAYEICKISESCGRRVNSCAGPWRERDEIDATYLDEVEKVRGLRYGVGADAARVAVQQHLFRLLVDHVKKLLETYGGVALRAGRCLVGGERVLMVF